MLLKIYEFITKMQDEIGDGAEVRLSARNHGTIEIRVDWWDRDFHARREFTQTELASVVDDSLPVNYFVAWCKNEYSRNAKRGLTPRALDGACESCKLELTPSCPIRTGNGCDLYQPRQ